MNTLTQRALPLVIHRYFEVSLFLLVTVGFLALASTGRLDLYSLLIVSVALAAKAQGLTPAITLRHVPGALDALNDGREAEHDTLIAGAASEMADVDVLLLAQFSMIGARDAIQDVPGRPVLSAPDEAVKKLKGLLAG